MQQTIFRVFPRIINKERDKKRSQEEVAKVPALIAVDQAVEHSTITSLLEKITDQNKKTMRLPN